MLIRWRQVLAVAIASALLFAFDAVQPVQAQTPLRVHVTFRGAEGVTNGWTFLVLGRRREQAVVFSVANQHSSARYALAPSFFQGIRVSVLQDGVPFPISMQLRRTVLASQVTGETSFPANVEVPLGPGDVVQFLASVQPTVSEFAEAKYEFTFDVQDPGGSVRVLEGSRGGPTPATQMKFLIYFADPKNPAEVTRRHLMEGGLAFDEERWLDALNHYRAILATDPSDRQAHAGSGHAHLRLGQLREAAASYELAITDATFKARSPIVDSLAYTYAAMGDIAKAEAVLARKGLSAAAIQVEIDRYRALIVK